MIEEGTAAYNAWVETPIPVYTKFYFFDMINPSDLFHSHEKPILEEKGPYTFRFGDELSTAVLLCCCFVQGG